MTLEEIYTQANLTNVERDNMPYYRDGSLLFYGSTAFEKLYEYFICEMPYGIAKARTGCPDEWILEKIDEGFNSESM